MSLLVHLHTTMQGEMLSTPGHRVTTNPTTGSHVVGFRPSRLDSAPHHHQPASSRVWTSSEIPADIVLGPYDDSVLNFGDRITEDSSNPTMIEVRTFLFNLF